MAPAVELGAADRAPALISEAARGSWSSGSSVAGAAALVGAAAATAAHPARRRRRHTAGARRVAAVVRGAVKEQEFAASGVLGSRKDLSRTKALGIELHQGWALAAPVSILDNSLVEEPLRLEHELGGDAAQNRKALEQSLAKILDHFNWKGLVGCCVSSDVTVKLGVDINADVHERESAVSGVLSPAFGDKVYFAQVIQQPVAAGYHNLIWGEGASEDQWKEKLVLVCTLDRGMDVTLFNNGRRVLTHPLDVLDRIAQLAEGNDWADHVDKHLCQMMETVPGVDRVVVVPESELGQAELPDAKKAAADRGCDFVTVAPPDGSMFRGAALCASVENAKKQLMKSLDDVLSHGTALHSLSESQLRMVFDSVDRDANGSLSPTEFQEVLSLLSIERDLGSLMEELDKNSDGEVTFDEFIAWWQEQVERASAVLLTSEVAWQELLQSEPDKGSGDLVVMMVSFTFCRSCRAFEKTYYKLAKEHTGARFVELIGNSTVGALKLSQDLGVKASPAFFVFRRGGELVKSWSGASQAKFLEHMREFA